MLRSSGGEVIPLSDARMALYRDVLGQAPSDTLFQHLRVRCPWQQAKIKLFGRRVASPRLTAWYGDAPYTYSGLTWPARAWPPELDALRRRAEALAGAAFNGVLLNLYRDGRDSMGWHSDDEPELGPDPVIASFTLGAPRRFVLRRRDDKSQKQELDLPHDSLLVMDGATQAHWQHAVPKTSRPVGLRINLTFRLILS